MLSHETVIDTDAISACYHLGLRGGLYQHRTDDRYDSQPQVADFAGAWFAFIGALWVHCSHPEPSQSAVCLTPAALRDLHAQSLA